MIHNLQLKWKRAWVEIGKLLGNTFDVGVQAVLQVCIKLATRHVCSTYISAKEEKPAKPSKDGKVGICCPLPTLLFHLHPSVIGSPASHLPSLPGPLIFSKQLWWLAAHQIFVLRFPQCCGKCLPWVYISQPTCIWNSSYQWPFLASLRSLPHAFSFLFCHWKQRTWALRMPEPQCGRSLGLWSSTWSKAVHSPRHQA